MMNFNNALANMQQGFKVRRKAWHKGCYMFIENNKLYKESKGEIQLAYNVDAISIMSYDWIAERKENAD